MRWKNTAWLGFGLLAVIILIHAAPSLARVPARIPSSLLRWGVILQSDEAFYQAGSTARVTSGIYNLTDQDLEMFFSKFGGNGCSYTMDIVDSQGRVVWQAGQIIGGNYIPPMCPGVPSMPVLIARNGGRTVTTENVQLIFQNPNGIGTLGSPLPAGFYRFRFQAGYTGPLRVGQNPAGFAPTATLPFQIEP